LFSPLATSLSLLAAPRVWSGVAAEGDPACVLDNDCGDGEGEAGQTGRTELPFLHPSPRGDFVVAVLIA